MGLFDFMSEAGKKLFGKKDEEEIRKANEEIQRLRQIRSRKMEAALAAEVKELGIEVRDLAIAADPPQVTVSGKTASQADREKIILALGNVAGVGRVEDKLAVDQSQPEAVFYTVQSGDSLSKIAKKQYGDAMKYPVIFEANRPMLSDPDKIYPGQVLRIPPLD